MNEQKSGKTPGLSADEEQEVSHNQPPRAAVLHEIIRAQGDKPFDYRHPPLAPLSFDISAASAGVVTGIDNLQLARIAGLAGAPKVQGAGVDLLRKLGEPVQPGTPLYRVYAAYPADLEFARQASARSSGYHLGEAGQVPQVFVEF